MKARLTFGSLLMVLALSGCAELPHLSDIQPAHRFPIEQLLAPAYNLPPAERLLNPGPGVGGPGPGVLPPAMQPSQLASVPIYGHPPAVATGNSIQILFNRPEAMQVRWDVGAVGHFDSEPLVVPGRKNFGEGGIYRLKITNIAGREGVELYPTLELGPTTPRTAAYLAHNAIPVQFTEEDFDQVLSGNFVTKVIYLPDPEFQEMALAGVETLVSTRLDPGMDPIVEADRRGSIMAVVRLGNKDIEMPDSNGGDQIMSAGYIAQANYGPQMCPPGAEGMAMGMGMPGMGMPGMGNPGFMPPAYLSGVTVPEYGMPISGTPIGLPGPPHIPFGNPAGLQRQVIKNHTYMSIPGPTESVKIHVKQRPGYSYPKPANHVFIREQNIHPTLNYHRPGGTEVIRNPTGYCPPGQE